MDLPKLELISKEGIKHELKMKRIDEDFLIDYIVKINETYNKLIDKVNEQDQIIREAREYVKGQIEYLKGQQDDFDYDKTIKTYCKGKLVTLNKISEILDRNVK